MAIQCQFTIPGVSRVPMTARAMAEAPAATARRADFGSFIQWREKTNSAVATR